MGIILSIEQRKSGRISFRTENKEQERNVMNLKEATSKKKNNERCVKTRTGDMRAIFEGHTQNAGTFPDKHFRKKKSEDRVSLTPELHCRKRDTIPSKIGFWTERNLTLSAYARLGRR